MGEIINVTRQVNNLRSPRSCPTNITNWLSLERSTIQRGWKESPKKEIKRAHFEQPRHPRGSLANFNVLTIIIYYYVSIIRHQRVARLFLEII